MYTDTVNAIKARGYLKAGVSLGINGLSYFNKEKSIWTGFDIDIAKAISAALFGNGDAVEYIPLQSGQRFTSLQTNIIDIGTFNSTLTMSREVAYGLSFMEPMLYDGEAFMVPKEVFEEAGQLASMQSRIVSAIRGSTTYQNLVIYFAKQQLDFEVILSDTPDEALSVYEQEKCNIYCLDRTLLAGERQRLAHPHDHLILPDIISREAMSPIVSSSDPVWAKAVKWILKALIEAEELGISQATIQEKKARAEGYTKEFLNPNPDLCEKLGLMQQFTEKVITQVGNYADIYERNLGCFSPLQLDRGENTLRSKGGLLYSPLFL